MNVTSGTVSRVEIGTMRAPALATPIMASTSSALFGRYNATRSPLRIPSPSNALASRHARLSSSRKVMRRSPQTTASRSGKRSAQSASSVPIFIRRGSRRFEREVTDVVRHFFEAHLHRHADLDVLRFDPEQIADDADALVELDQADEVGDAILEAGGRNIGRGERIHCPLARHLAPFEISPAGLH